LANLAVPAPVRATAIIDSGAGITCIDLRQRQSLGLILSGTVTISTPFGHASGQTADTFSVYLAILHPNGNPANHLVSPRFRVVEANLAHLGVEILIGCDLLARCDFRYNGRAGRFTLEY
jgi:hypothetical protein